MKDLDPQTHIEEILDAILKIASGRYLFKVPIYNKNDNLDAIAQGINMLGEEIESKITEQIQDNRELKELSSKMEAITTSAIDAIIVLNPQKKISYWNPAAEKMFGYGRREILNKDLHSILAPERYRSE